MKMEKIIEEKLQNIKVRYDNVSTLVKGYYPSDVNYINNVIDETNKIIDNDPYIEISQEEWELNRNKQMAVINNIYQEYVLFDDEKNYIKKNQLINLREKYLDKTFRESVEHLLEREEYPNKSKRENAKQEIEKIRKASSFEDLEKYELEIL